ncbi:MAG: TATA-box-binding protein [Thermoplasmata archaeon]|nr:TATA-box-binding protein [Euryarchaeota archaeon]RLF64212.1 MAG: TATA-box-binding protein [Thermoplasmata archaeon]
MVKYEIQNVVASAIVATELDLDKVAESLENVEYEPEQFPGLVLRFENIGTVALLFRSGKVVCTGGKSEEDIMKTVEELRKILKDLGFKLLEPPKVEIQNIVASVDLEGELDLSEVAIKFGPENVEYDPEQFPGLVYRMDDPKVAILVFGSGKLVIAGAKTTEDVKRAVDAIKEKLESLGLIKYKS